jgi:arsenical pump membrane protein
VWKIREMTHHLRLWLTLGIFAATMVPVLAKPRGWSEGWWTSLGAGAMRFLGLVSDHDVVSVAMAGKNALLFLLALLLLSALLDRSGFFEWAAIEAGRRAGGNTRTLYRNVFVLGAIATAVLSLDTTAVIVTPVVLGFVDRLQLPARPFVVACAFVANVASLLLPVSNLTNLLFADTFHFRFSPFAARMVLPQLVALGVAYWLLRWHFRRELPDRFDATRLPRAESVIRHRPFFRTAAAVVALVLLGYFVAPALGTEPYAVGFLGAAVLAAVGLASGQVRVGLVKEVPWGIFPFVVGLFVMIRGIENLGWVADASGALSHLPPGPVGRVVATASVTGLVSNLTNNLPAALAARSVLEGAHADDSAIFASLLGCDIGPTIVPTASLATMLVLALARRKGARVTAVDMLKPGLWITPLVLLASALALAATFFASG